MNDWFRKIQKERSVTVLEAEGCGGNRFRYRFVVLKLKGQQLEIKEHKGPFESPEALTKAKQGHPSVVLMLKGNGILHRKLEGQVPFLQALHGMLPNANTDDFYVESVTTAHATFVSVVRRDLLAPLLTSLDAIGWLVTDVRLAPLPMAALALLSGNGTEMSDGVYKVRFKAGEMESLETSSGGNPSNIGIGEKTVQSDLILPFSAGLGHFFPLANRNFSETAAITDNRAEHHRKQMFRIGGWALLLVLFGSLLVNFFLHDHYAGKLNRLQTTSNMNARQLNRINTLRNEIRQKKALLQSAGISGNYSMAFRADQIGLTVPETIQLKKLNLLPLKKPEKDGKRLIFDHEHLVVAGSVNRSTTLNKWIKELEGLHWVKRVDLLDYMEDDKTHTDKFTFQITLQ